MTNHEEVQNGVIFPSGEPNDAFAEFFTGQSYLNTLVNDEDVDVVIGNVTFEPACRNNWHIHTEGYQILLVTGGEGWYQEEGKEAQKLYPGSVVVTQKGINHCHGATADSWFEHIAITAGPSEFLEPVTEEQYNSVS